MVNMWAYILKELLTLAFTIFGVILMRWLLELSTPRKDWEWVKRNVPFRVERWENVRYRYRAWRLLRGWDV